MTIAVDLGRKATKQTKTKFSCPMLTLLKLTLKKLIPHHYQESQMVWIQIRRDVGNSAAFHLGLQCLQSTCLGVFSLQSVKVGVTNTSSMAQNRNS